MQLRKIRLLPGLLRSACVSAWLLVCLLSAAPLPAANRLLDSGNYTRTVWDMSDGLPHNLVHDIVQDRDGYIWASTWEGVVRFDGTRFTVFDSESTPHVPLSGAFSLVAEPEGGVTVATVNDGIFRYRDGQWSELGKGVTGQLSINQMLRDRDGSLWLAAGRRLLQLDRDGGLRDAGLAAGLPPLGIRHLTQVDDLLLVSARQGAWQLRQGKASPWGEAAGFDRKSIRQISSDHAGGWLVVADDGVWHWHQDGTLEQLLAGSRARAALVDRERVRWISLSDGGLLRHARGQPEQQIQLPGVSSPALLQDNDGLIWVGNTTGLYRVMRGAVAGLTAAQGLGNEYVRVVQQTGDGTVWIGHAAGVDRWRPGRSRAEPVDLLGGHSGTVTALASAGRNGMWVGTYDQGIVRVDAAGRQREHVRLSSAGQLPPMVRALLATDEGVLIGTATGLLRLRQGSIEAYGQALGLTTQTIYGLSADTAGRVWIVGSAGVVMLAPDGRLRQWQSGRDLPAQVVFDLHHDPDGTLWLASNAGLLRWRDGEVTTFDHRNGLPRNRIFRIIDDRRGHFWLSSNQGVFRIQRTDLERVGRHPGQQLPVDVVDASDGMPGGQVNGASAPAGWLHADGRLLFPTGRGLAVIDPARVGNARLQLPPLRLQTLSTDGQTQALHGNAVQLQANGGRLSIRYVALAYSAPDKLRYRYRMVGYDAGWVDAGRHTEAVYTNLPAGNYRFQVQAMQQPLDWSDQRRLGQASLAIEMVPQFWQRPLVWAGGVLMLVLAVLVALRLRVRGYQKRQRRLNALVEARTAELNRQNLALEEAGRERDALLQQLAVKASHDELTGLPNRRAGDEYLQRCLAQAQQHGTGFSVALLDVDSFKQVNDTHGHAAGDALLHHLARELEASDCGTVFVARHGGEEFLLVLEGQPLAVAVARMERLRLQAQAGRVVLADGRDLQFSVSIGVAAYGPDQDTVRSLLAAADANLYVAKREGRNRVVG